MKFCQRCQRSGKFLDIVTLLWHWYGEGVLSELQRGGRQDGHRTYWHAGRVDARAARPRRHAGVILAVSLIAVAGEAAGHPPVRAVQTTDTAPNSAALPPGDNYLHYTENRGYPDPQFRCRSKPTIQAQPGPYIWPFHWDSRPGISRLEYFWRLASDDHKSPHLNYLAAFSFTGPPAVAAVRLD
jgi:hypothetical protein